MVGLDFLNIHERISHFATSVVYDRAGTGWSDHVNLPRSAAEVTDELRSLLRVADARGPYVLVGHSLGGAYARRYAQRFPDEVAGLLLLEPSVEDFNAHMPKQTTFERLRGIVSALRLVLRYRTVFRGLFQRMFAEWPDSIREPLIEYHLATLRKTLEEWPPSQRTDNGALMNELRNGEKMHDVPLIVVAALGLDWSMKLMMAESYLRKMNDGKRIVFTALAESVPHGEYREVENAGHSTIHIDCPDVVVQAIRDILNKVDRGRRDKGATPACRC
jgi:pimeloyl-ACP methyl ester carboxylesterase